VRLDEVLAPLQEVVPLILWRKDVEVFRVKVQCVSKDGCFWVHPYRADPAVPPRKAAREAAEADCGDANSDDLGRSSGSDGKFDGLSDLSQSDISNLMFLLIGRL
jgi:hypothetical protein